MEDLGCDILGFFAPRYPAGYVCVHAIEMCLVEFGKAARVSLCSRDQGSLVRIVFGCLQSVSAMASYLSNHTRGTKGYGSPHDYFALLLTIRL